MQTTFRCSLFHYLSDTATVYRNEAAIGNSLKRILEQNLVPGLTRQDIFLTSKLGKFVTPL